MRVCVEQQDLTSIPFLGGFLPNVMERHTLEAGLSSNSPPASFQSWYEDLKLHLKRAAVSLLLKTLQLVEFAVALGQEAVQGLRKAVERRPPQPQFSRHSEGTVQSKNKRVMLLERDPLVFASPFAECVVCGDILFVDVPVRDASACVSLAYECVATSVVCPQVRTHAHVC